MSKDNPCNNCTRRITSGVRIIRRKSGELSRQLNYICEAYNLPLFNIEPVPYCTRQNKIPISEPIIN
jgi:hypothetical protein